VSVTLDSSNQPDVGICVDENLHVAQLSYSLVDEQQDSVDNHNIGCLHARWLRAAKVRHEIVLGLVDRHSLRESDEMRAQQVVIERIRVVPIEFSSFGEGQTGEILVIRIHVDKRDGRRRQKFSDIFRDGRFSRSGSAGDSDYQRLEHSPPNLRWLSLERIMPFATTRTSS